ncbi:MAG: helix-turn-helix transcriptional regulator [Peptococcaceae bacterium]|nr:helix-turn-helix transcriptional regulator [Peptococcaceae bacterium]
MKAIIAARVEQNLTQEELSRKTGIRQSNISRIENGNCSPTIATLQQIADGVGKTLHIEFR